MKGQPGRPRKYFQAAQRTDVSYKERFYFLIQHLEMLIKQHELVARHEPKYSWDAALSRAKANCYDFLLEIAKAYCEDQPWIYDKYNELIKKYGGQIDRSRDEKNNKINNKKGNKKRGRPSKG